MLSKVASIYNAQCNECALCQECITVCMTGRGRISNSPVMLVGEAPGENEDRTGTVFCGKAGRKLRDIATEIYAYMPFDIDDCFITNAVKCRPPLNKAPSIKELRACRQYLLEEIDIIQPKVIIALGLIAAKSLLDKGTLKLGDIINQKHTIEVKGKEYPVYATYHPAAVLRFPHYQPDVVSHITRALSGEIPDEHPTEEIYSVDVSRDFLALDIETYPGLDPFHADAYIRMVSLSSELGKAAVYMDYLKPIYTLLDSIFHYGSYTLCGSNIQFDIKWIKHFYPDIGIHMKYWDTRVMERLLFPQNMDRGLKSLTLKYAPEMGDYAKEVRRKVKDRGGFQHLSDGEIKEYALNDADASLRVTMRQYILSHESDREHMGFYSELIPVLVDMELKGMYINTERKEELRVQYKKEIQERKERLETELDIKNINSPQQLADCLKLENTNKKTLKKHIHRLPVIKEILEYRSLSKLYNTYIKGMDKWLVKDTIRPSFKIDGTDTGRLSSASPNGQNIASNYDIQSMFSSRFEGGSIVSIDFSQAEIWGLAQLTGDIVLYRDLSQGTDIHQTMADWLRCGRKSAKTTTFHIIYGGSAFGLARRVGCPFNVAETRLKGWFSRYRGVSEWQSRMRQKARSDGFVETAYGRRYRFPPNLDWNSMTDKGFYPPEVDHYYRCAVNAPVQGTIGRYCQAAQVALWPEVVAAGGVMINQIHDEILLDIPPDCVVDCVRRVREVLGDFDGGLGIKIPYKIKIGPNWAELKELTPEMQRA